MNSSFESIKGRGSVPGYCARGRRAVGICGAILAGGESRRMGSDKALLPFQGARLIDHVYARMSHLFGEVLIVTNSPQLYHELPCRKVSDVFVRQGALAGIHAALVHARQQHVFVVGCDMPWVSPALVQSICAYAGQGDLILPVSSGGREPLHALYDKSCLPEVERMLKGGEKRIASFFDQVQVVEIPAADLQQIDPLERSFRNINTPEDYFRLRHSAEDGVFDNWEKALKA